MSLEIGVIVGLAVSVAVNGLLIWYARRAYSNAMYIADRLEDIILDVETFGNHLEQVYEMETFYGDETLAALLTHARDTQTSCSGFRESFVLEFEENETDEAEIVDE